MTRLLSYLKASGVVPIEEQKRPTAQDFIQPPGVSAENESVSRDYGSNQEMGCVSVYETLSALRVAPQTSNEPIRSPNVQKPRRGIQDIRKEYCIDDSSDIYDENGQVRKAGQKRSSRTRKGGNDSDSDVSDDYDESDDYVWDSDLESDQVSKAPSSHARTIKKLKSVVKGRFERSLIECVVNTDRIAPGYQEIFIKKETINKLEQVTSLALRRPKAFSHGVLKGHKVTGAILYGPPGTGKSLLAKAVAKESGFLMLSVSTAELWQKCHGEDEKMIKALFSVARKMHPCIIFLDEADAMLGARKGGEKRHIRAMLNQFLMEWDGLGNGEDAPFLLLATNRPYDLDSAVLRRAPVQIALDIPTLEERMGILNLLLKDEKLDTSTVRIDMLANLTKNYTGSDLKNLCVTAATTCVTSQHTDTTQRVLTRDHFFAALQTVRATNMDRVGAHELRKFGGKVAGYQAQAEGEEE